MLDHRTAARAGAPHGAHRPRAASFFALDLTDGSHARSGCASSSAASAAARRSTSGPDCTCGCGGGWNRHLAYVELLRLRVQTWTPPRGGERA
jgi:hypothetical protein